MNTGFIPFDASRMGEAISYKTVGGDVVTQVTKFETDRSNYPVIGVLNGDIMQWTLLGEAINTERHLLMEIKQEIKFPCLCWVGDYKDYLDTRVSRIIVSKQGDLYADTGDHLWHFATPLTDVELSDFGLKKIEG